MDTAPSKGQPLLNEFLSTHGAASIQNVLIAHAPEVIVMAQYAGVEQVTKFFSEKLGKVISRRAVDILLKRFRNGEMPIEHSELISVANSNPDTARFFKYQPHLLMPDTLKAPIASNSAEAIGAPILSTGLNFEKSEVPTIKPDALDQGKVQQRRGLLGRLEEVEASTL